MQCLGLGGRLVQRELFEARVLGGTGQGLKLGVYPAHTVEECIGVLGDTERVRA